MIDKFTNTIERVKPFLIKGWSAEPAEFINLANIGQLEAYVQVKKPTGKFKTLERARWTRERNLICDRLHGHGIKFQRNCGMILVELIA